MDNDVFFQKIGSTSWWQQFKCAPTAASVCLVWAIWYAQTIFEPQLTAICIVTWQWMTLRNTDNHWPHKTQQKKLKITKNQMLHYYNNIIFQKVAAILHYLQFI
jgi:hypothetical protein